MSLSPASLKTPIGNTCEPINKVRFLDLRVGVTDNERCQYLIAIGDILASGEFLNSPQVKQFEAKCKELCKAKYAVGVGSGTAALYMALRRLQIGPGHEVILPALGFVGSANAVRATGATPVFVDVRRDLLIDPQAVEAALTDRTRAVMPVHFAGNVCDITALLTLLLKRAIDIVEDAAPAWGATYNGHPAGSFGRLGCFSMNPMKVLGGIGEAGLIIGNHVPDESALRELRYHGMRGPDECVDVSLNFRMDAIQAAVLLLRLQSAKEQLRQREYIARLYSAGLARLSDVKLPVIAENVCPAWYSYIIICSTPRSLCKHLDSRGIEAKVDHHRLVPYQDAHLITGEWPVAESLAPHMISLPIHHHMTVEGAGRVIDAVQEFYHG